MQQAFIDHDALQCGYCTPGQIMAAVACVAEGNATSRGSIREYMSGNICRCGAYPGIVAAIDIRRWPRLMRPFSYIAPLDRCAKQSAPLPMQAKEPATLPGARRSMT